MSIATRPLSSPDKAELRRVIASSSMGQFVEFYDFVIYAYSAKILGHLFFPDADPVAATLSVFAVYAVGFAIRPVGGVVFGMLGDKIGRRAVLTLVIVMMGAGTTAIGLLPTYEAIGVAAPILLVLCRLVQGFAAAGETMTSNAFVAEHAPAHRRGLYLSITFSFTTLPSMVAALVVWGLINGLGQAAYESWGWRVAFLISAPLALVGLYIRSRINESPAYEASKAARLEAARQQAQVRRASSKRAIIQALALGSIGAVGFYTLSGYMVTYLTKTVQLSQNQALLSNSVALFVAFVSFWLGGLLCDRFGRRPILLGTVASVVVLYWPSFLLAGNGSIAGAILGQSVIGFVLGVFYGVFAISVLESFSTHNRVRGAVICFNVSYTVFGGTAPLVAEWLIKQTGYAASPAVYMTVVAFAVLLVVIALRMPETLGTSLLHEDDVAPVVTR